MTKTKSQSNENKDYTCVVVVVVGLPKSVWSSLNLSGSSSFSLQKVATQFTSCSPNRSHCLSDTPSTFRSVWMLDGL